MLLSELPRETLLHIFDYVPTLELWRNVRCTSKYFNALLLRNSYWLQRAQEYYGVHLPSRLKDYDKPGCFDEAKRSHAVETVVHEWGAASALAIPTITQIHYGTVDAICQFRCKSTRRNVCFTAARDRSIIMWNIDAMRKEKDRDTWISSNIEAAHEGWIWHMCMKDDSELYSAGWDRQLKQWLLRESSITRGSHLTMDTAVLSCISDGSSIIYASTYNAGPIACDTRDGLKVQNVLECHENFKPVFSMATGHDTNYIYSIGEDSRLVVVDKRNFTEPVRSWRTGRHRMSKIHYSAGYLGLSFRNGLLLFMNPETLEIENRLWLESDGAEKPAEDQMSTNHFCMSLSAGAIFCAYGQQIKLYTPGLKPTLLSSYEADALISQVDCNGDVLVAGSGMGSLCFWL